MAVSATLVRVPLPALVEPEERVAAYVIREHDRGRTLAEILEDPLRPEPARRRAARAPARPARDHPGDRQGHDRRRARRRSDQRLELAPTPRSRARSTTRGADRHVPGGEPVRLEDDDVVVGDSRPGTSPATTSCSSCTSSQSRTPRSTGSIRSPDSSRACSRRVAADERRALEHDVVELARARRRSRRRRRRARPRAATRRAAPGPRRRDRDDDVLLGRLARATRPARRRRSRRTRASRSASGSRRRRARSPGTAARMPRPATRPASRSRSRRALRAPARRGTAPRRRSPRPSAAGRACPPRCTAASSPVRGVEEQHDEAALPGGEPAYDLTPGVAELAVDARHDGEAAVVERRAARAGRLSTAPARQPAEATPRPPRARPPGVSRPSTSASVR